MTKYYRVVKDHPLWDEGAILSNVDSSSYYAPISDVWTKDLGGNEDFSTYREGEKLVMNQPEWFQQVYPIGKLEKMVFGDKKQAQAAASALYKGGKK